MISSTLRAISRSFAESDPITRKATGKGELNQQFSSVRVWKKLLLHDSHSSARHEKRTHYNSGYRIFFPDAPRDKLAKPLVSRGGIDPRMASFYRFDLG